VGTAGPLPGHAHAAQQQQQGVPKQPHQLRMAPLHDAGGSSPPVPAAWLAAADGGGRSQQRQQAAAPGQPRWQQQQQWQAMLSTGSDSPVLCGLHGNGAPGLRVPAHMQLQQPAVRDAPGSAHDHLLAADDMAAAAAGASPRAGAAARGLLLGPPHLAGAHTTTAAAAHPLEAMQGEAGGALDAWALLGDPTAALHGSDPLQLLLMQQFAGAPGE
jgi:hypothetical protein